MSNSAAVIDVRVGAEHPVLHVPVDVLGDADIEVIWEPPTAFRYFGWRLMAKRVLDVTAALVGLVVLLPVAVVIAALVAIGDPGPVLYTQERVGRSGRIFRIMKFRSMYTDATERLESDPDLYARYLANDYKLDLDEDPRITRIGRFLRKSSLDEIPQLWNVVRGDMSLVGPRPVLRKELPCYGPLASAYLAVYPGITGLWQVEGRNDIMYPERAVLDTSYVEGWSMWRDVKLLARTVPSAIRSHGVH